MTLTPRWLWLFAAGIAWVLLADIAPLFLSLAFLWYAVLIGLAVADWRRLPAPDRLRVEREAESRLSLGVDGEVKIRVRSAHESPLRMELRDSPPTGMTTDAPATPFQFTVPAQGRHGIIYHLMPRERGDFRFGNVHLRVEGGLGMVRRTQTVPAVQSVRVYPDLREAAKFDLLTQRGRLQQTGVRAARIQGIGREFESLRDYQPDDEMRRIDWKASARRGKLVSRQYEVERSQNIILVLDIGRTMLADLDGSRKIDYAIQAALVLAYVATQTEDHVGLLVFGDRVRTYLPPKKGRGQVYAILEALYNVQASLVEPDYRAAFAELRLRWRKRSLIVCFTDLWDSDSSRTAVAELAALQPHHLVAAVTMLDTNLQRVAEQPPATLESVYDKAVATQLLEDRRRARAALEGRGVLVVDTPAERLSAELVNRYLEIKNRMLL